MKAVVCIIGDQLKDITQLTRESKNIAYNKRQVIFWKDFESITTAKAFVVVDLYYSRPDTELLKKVANGKLREFNTDHVNITIRTGNERESLLGYLNSL